ncbi:MAG: hypothetical protein A2Z14_12710 [Chloroflexi bacterium RBG_16_48_8]|nr:MAG: hypothetical protein A2Z14_12710 [Chloroflexi bacterium RBG_16_48_8]
MWAACVFTTAGFASTIYGFVQAYRGALFVSSGYAKVFFFALITTGLLGAMYGFFRGYKAIFKQILKKSDYT